MSRRLRRWAAPVRVKVSLAAAGVVAIVTVLGALGMFFVISRSLYGSLRQSTIVQATAVAGMVRGGNLPSSLPESPSLIQVLSPSGRVLASDPAAAKDSALAGRIRGPGTKVAEVSSLGGHHVRRNATLPGVSEGPWIVAKMPVPSARGAMTVVVATSVDTLGEFLSHLALLLVVGFPILLMMGGLLAWILAGRALAPVEKIRVEVASVAEGDLTKRVTEPDTQDEVGKLARTMNSMLDRLQAYAMRQRDFAADASHELRTPIAAIRAQLEVALAHPERDWRAVAGEVLGEVHLMGRVVEDLLSLARQGSSPAKSDPVDLDEIVLSEAKLARWRCERDGHIVSVDATRVSAGRVVGDPDQLRRMVRNLCDNAVHHARSEVRLSLSASGGFVELAVADDGSGIPIAYRERVFERFARLDESRSRDGGGAGLGLAIVKDIVSRHHGVVAVEMSDAGVGAKFVVRLPEGA